MSKLSELKQRFKILGFCLLIMNLSADISFSSDLDEEDLTEDVSGLTVSVPESAEDGKLVDKFDPRSIPKAERNKRWTEEAPTWAANWGMPVDEYLRRADSFISYLRENKKKISGRENLFRLPKPDLDAMNAAYSERYGRTWRVNDVHMFSLRG